MEWVNTIGNALGEFFAWLKQFQDPEIKRKNRLIQIDRDIAGLIAKRHYLIEDLKNESNQEKRDSISSRIVDISDQLHRLRVEKEKLQS